MGAEVSGALHSETDATHVRMAESALQAGPDPVECAERGMRRGVAACCADTDHTIGFPMHEIHVRGRGTDVLHRHVAAAERVDRAPELSQRRLALVGFRIADQHSLAAAEVEPGDCRRVGHPVRQAQYVAQRVLLGRVGPHPAPAERGPEQRAVDRDQALESRLRLLTEHDLFMPELDERIEQFHAV